MPFTKLSAASLLLASVAMFSIPAQANLSQQQSAAIIKAYDGSDPADFKQFLGKLAGSELAKADKLDETLKQYLAGKPLAAEQQDEINRLLGLYTRIKYGKAATETLRELVEIPTYRKEGVEQHENPEFLKIADKIKALAEGFGLTFRNIDNRVYEISSAKARKSSASTPMPTWCRSPRPTGSWPTAPSSTRSRSPWWATACTAVAPRTTRTASSSRSMR